MSLFSIEGNIGSGKSTLINLLKDLEKENFDFLDEPVKVWDTIKDSSGVTILEKYYKDQSRYAFSFQMMAYITRVSELKKVKSKVTITERSVYTDREIFAKMLHDSGKIEEIEYLIYNKWFDEFLESIKIQGIIYVYTPPVLCIDRIEQRNRKGEESIPSDYIHLCDEYHEKWIRNSDIPILYVDGRDEYTFETIDKIKEFVKNNLKK